MPDVKISKRVTVTKSYFVEMSEDALADIVRDVVGAPPSASVSVSDYNGASVTWTETENPKDK